MSKKDVLTQNFIMVLIRMKQPHALLYLQRPTEQDALETFAELIRNRKISDLFEVERLNISKRGEFSFG